MAMRRIKKELVDLNANPVPNTAVGPRAEDLFDWHGTLIGVEDTPYAGGIFFFDLRFPSDYPFQPPRLRMSTKVLHPSVHGPCIKVLCPKTGVDLLDRASWSPVFTVRHLLEALTATFAIPPPQSKADDEVFAPSLRLARRQETILGLHQCWSGASELAPAPPPLFVMVAAILRNKGLVSNMDTYRYDAINPEVDNMFRHQRDKFDRTAREWTLRYAT